MDRNSIIKKSHIKAVEKFNQELIAFADYTQDYPPTLYEDIFTSFTLWNVYVKDGCLCYEYDGKMEKDDLIMYDEEEEVYFEDEYYSGIMNAVKFWRTCLRRAKKYFAEDPEVLDRIYDGEMEDLEIE